MPKMYHKFKTIIDVADRAESAHASDSDALEQEVTAIVYRELECIFTQYEAQLLRIKEES
jgi:hypothetical protein